MEFRAVVELVELQHILVGKETTTLHSSKTVII